MRIISLFLSSLLSFVALWADTGDISRETMNFDPHRCAFVLETSNACLTGILITKESEETIDGSMINEFGVSAIDFTYNRTSDKLKLVNVIGFLNKWYIKRVLKNDIKLCLHSLYNIPDTKTDGYIIERTDSSISVINGKRKLKYSFSTLSPDSPSDETER